MWLCQYQCTLNLNTERTGNEHIMMCHRGNHTVIGTLLAVCVSKLCEPCNMLATLDGETKLGISIASYHSNECNKNYAGREHSLRSQGSKVLDVCTPILPEDSAQHSTYCLPVPLLPRHDKHISGCAWQHMLNTCTSATAQQCTHQWLSMSARAAHLCLCCVQLHQSHPQTPGRVRSPWPS